MQIAILLSTTQAESGLARAFPPTATLTWAENILSADEAEATLRTWAGSAAYNLLCVHAEAYAGLAEVLAADYPRQPFALQSTEVAASATRLPYGADWGAGATLLGEYAARRAPQGVFGVIAPLARGSYAAYVEGWIAGIARRLPQATVHVIYTESPTDRALALEAAHAQAENSVTVLTAIGEFAPLVGRVAAEHGLLWLGDETGAAFLRPHWALALRPLWHDLQNGTPRPPYLLNPANGGLSLQTR